MPSNHVSPGDGTDVSGWDLGGGVTGARFDSAGRRAANQGLTAPAVAAGAGAGTSPTVAVANATDETGQLTVTAGTSPAAGTLATITFRVPFGAVPKSVVVSPADAASAALNPYASATATVLTVGVQGAPTGAASYKFNWLVVGA